MVHANHGDTKRQRTRGAFRFFVSLGLAWLAAGASVRAGSVPVTPDTEIAVRAAIVAAVTARVGEAARVTIDQLQLDVLASPAHVVARIEPGATAGRLARFTLVSPAPGRPVPAPVGLAAAVVRIAAPHVRATRDLARGEMLAAADLASTVDDVGAVALQRYPQTGDILGARVLRPIRTGETIVASAVALPSLVRSGESIEGYARAGHVEIVATLTAAQSGALGDVILVVNPTSGRRLKARVSRAGRVEVLP